MWFSLFCCDLFNQPRWIYEFERHTLCNKNSTFWTNIANKRINVNYQLISANQPILHTKTRIRAFFLCLTNQLILTSFPQMNWEEIKPEKNDHKYTVHWISIVLDWPPAYYRLFCPDSNEKNGKFNFSQHSKLWRHKTRMNRAPHTQKTQRCAMYSVKPFGCHCYDILAYSLKTI